VDVAKAPKGRGQFCPLAEANGNKTGALFLKLTTLGAPLSRSKDCYGDSPFCFVVGFNL
jgi:hypothetical protein